MVSRIALSSAYGRGQRATTTLINDLQDGYGSYAQDDDMSADYPAGGGTGTRTCELSDTYNDMDQVLRLQTTDGVASAYASMDLEFDNAVNLYDGGCISFFFKIEAPTTNAILKLYATHDNFSNWTLYSRNAGGIAAGWQELKLRPQDFAGGSGGAGCDWSALNQIRFRIDTTNGDQETMLMGEVYTNAYDRPMYLFTFDDGYANAYHNAYPILAAAGFKATCFLTYGLVPGTGVDDDTSKMTNAQIEELHAAGWDMGNHFNDHSETMDNKTSAEIVAGMNACRDYLNSQGWSEAVNHGAYIGTGGDSSNPTDKMMNACRSAGMLTMATTRVINTMTPTITNDYFETIPRRNAAQGIAAATLTAQVDDLIQYGGTALMYAHSIADTEVGASDWATSKLQTLVNYVKAASDDGLLDVVTISEWYDRAINSKRRAA